MTRPMSCVVALILIVVAAPAVAQQYMHREDLPMHERQRLEAEKRSNDAAYAKSEADDQALRQKLLRLPPLPDESNLLLGSWRVEGGGQGRDVNALGKGTGGTDAMLRELWTTLQLNLDKLLCIPMFGNGITCVFNLLDSCTRRLRVWRIR